MTDIDGSEGIGAYVGRRMYEEHAKKARGKIAAYLRKAQCPEADDGFVCGTCDEGRRGCDREDIAALIERMIDRG